MFGLFKKKNPIEQLYKEYDALQKEAYELSKINRTKSDEKVAEAEAVMQKIKELESK